MVLLSPNAKERILAMALADRMCANCTCIVQHALSMRDEDVLKVGEIAIAKDPSLAPELATILCDDGYDVEVGTRQVRCYTMGCIIVLEVVGIVLKSPMPQHTDAEGDSGPPVFVGDRDTRETPPVVAFA
ncbi:MAG TPA: hypothetical protein VG984_02275 [Candidatus Paceibacterota bacterium]|nr:hypothetical protein [Candidatus Paceibacterota bacterium]